MKKATLVAVFLSLPGSAFAEDMGTAFSGPSVSVGAGYQANRIDRENVHTTNGVFSFNQPDASGKGLSLQVQAGYGFKVGERFSISANAFFKSGSGKTSATTAAFFQDSVVQKIGNSFGVYVAPEVYLTARTLLFAKAGFGFASWEYHRAYYGVSLDKSVSGALVGVGVKQLISEKIFVGVDLTRQYYRAASSVTPLSIYDVEVSARSRQTTATLSVGYLF